MQYPKQVLNLFNNRLFQHIAFWGFFIFLETLHIYDKFEDGNLLFGFTVSIFRFSAAMILVYLNIYIFIPKLLEKGKYILYVVIIISSYFLIVYTTYGLYLTFMEDSVEIWNNDERLPRFLGGLFGITFLLTILSALIHFAKRWVKLKDIEIELKDEQHLRLEAELKTLKGQINPHFLFNSLNNIYSLSLDKSDLAPEMILKLSDLMSYIIYDARYEIVSMKKELEFVKNHVELEGLRVKNKVKLEFDTDSSLEQYEIAPLLFTPFVENAFKYVAKQNKDKAFIRIEIKNTEGELHFLCSNFAEAEATVFEHNNHGIGIENVKKRLALIYPGKHKLDIEHKQETFCVNLKIKIQ